MKCCVMERIDMIVKKQKNEDVWNLGDYDFLKEKAAPDTINPSLWFNAKLNFQAGLFWVVKDKIFQIRGFDEETVSESIYARTAMSRRGRYQFAFGLKTGRRSVVSGGLGLSGRRYSGTSS